MDIKKTEFSNNNLLKWKTLPVSLKQFDQDSYIVFPKKKTLP